MSEKVVIVTAPSGAGKTTIVQSLLEKFDQLSFSVSACTRKRRSHEEEGKDYYFFTREEFIQKIKEDAFLEFEEVYEGAYYGTLKSEVERIWSLGRVIIFDVDVKGAENLKHHFEDKALAVFIKPPSMVTLKKRLISRQTENPNTLRKRLQRAELELAYESHFDHVILNDNLQKAIRETQELVRTFLLSD